MATNNYTTILNELKGEITNMVVSSASAYADAAKHDAQALLSDMDANLQTWTQQLATGEISAQDLAFLVKAQKDLMKMQALKQAGLSAIAVDKLKNDVISVITSTIIGKI